MRIPFNYPYITGKEADYISEVVTSRKLSGNGKFSAQCEQWLELHTECSKALLTPSCTAALEMAAMLIQVKPDDEIIMPSYTFVSTANAFAQHGAKPVFVDIRPDTLNIDETKIEAAITNNTKAIVILHYAGVACNVEPIIALAKKHNLYVIEDNAHGILASYKDKPLGSFGDLATLSFHETKNITCGQGGALLINDKSLIERAYVLRDKGTNRQAFEQGSTKYYSWVDKGSNYCLSEIQAAFLWAQMEAADTITRLRMDSWKRYMDAFLECNKFRLPVIPNYAQHNGHIFRLVLQNKQSRDELIAYLADNEIYASFHYVPLHNSPAYTKFFSCPGTPLPVTEQISDSLVRLPLWSGMDTRQTEVINAVSKWMEKKQEKI